MKDRRKGFTLIELLIVIVVIGILSAMMMVTSTEIIATTKAARIISDMRQLKTATIAWYLENTERVVSTNATRKKDGTPNGSLYKIKVGNQQKEFSDFIKTNSSEIMNYISNGKSKKLLDRKNAADKYGEYVLTAMAYSTKWYVCYNVGNDSKLKTKLKGKQDSVGLLGTNKIDDVGGNTGNSPISNAYTDQKFVCLLIFDFGD